MVLMTHQGHLPSEDLKAVIDAGGISEDALHAITRIPAETVARFLHGEAPDSQPGTSTPLLSDDESRRLSIFSAYVSTGLTIDDDERLRAILESLTVACRLTPENVARLADVDVEHVERALVDPSAVPLDARYRLALRSSYIITAVDRAQPR